MQKNALQDMVDRRGCIVLLRTVFFHKIPGESFKNSVVVGLKLTKANNMGLVFLRSWIVKVLRE